MGPVASGASVIADSTVVDLIKSQSRKLVGIEMETYGVFLAARVCGRPRPLAMSVKSICDFADASKADDYQRYAAYTSASFLYEFAIEMLASEQPS
jgi:nucleoside phosphorylase